MATSDIMDTKFASVIHRAYILADLEYHCRNCFVGLYEQEAREEEDVQFLDDVDSDEEPIPIEIENAVIRDEELLEEIPLPGAPVAEAARRKKWLKIPRRARTAIRKMHREWGHIPRPVLKQILKASKAPPEFLEAVDNMRCETCVLTAKPKQTNKVGPPKPYIFNKEVGIDVFDLHDYEGNCHLFLNSVCQGTNFQIVVYLCAGPGTPKSRVCSDNFMMSWVSWAGWPEAVVTDRGLHNRGRFSRMLGAHGICIRNIALESPEQLGRTERHGDMWKAIAKRTIHDQRIVGIDHMKLLTFEMNPTMNDGTRKGGFAPSQWVLGKFPRRPGCQMDEDEFADLGVISERLDAQSAFALQSKYRTACRKSFAEEDCSIRVSKSLLRKSAPIPADYAVGDLVSFKRMQGAVTPEQRWSTPTRLIGFDGEKVTWGLCEGLPVCIATDKIRPCTPSETLAYLYLHKHHPRVDYTPPRDGDQQNYIDASRDPQREHDSVQVDSVQIAEDEDVEDEVAEFEGRDAERLEAEPVEDEEEASIADFIRELGERSDAQEPPATSTKRALHDVEDDLPTQFRRTEPAASSSSLSTNWERSGTQGRGVELLEQLEAKRSARDRSRTPEKKLRQAFLAERVAVDKGTNKNVRKQIAGKNLKYDQCDAKTQKGLRASRAKEWKKWMDFDAGRIIQGEVLKELLDDGFSMLPTQWIETDQRAHLQRPGEFHEPDLKSRLVACGQFEDKRGLRSDSPTADVEALNLICSYAAMKRLRLKCGDVQNAYFSADNIDRLLLLHPPKGGIPGEWSEEKIAIVANKPIYGTPDAGRGFYKKVRRLAKESKLTECPMFLSVYTYQVDGDIKVMMGAHVDDILWWAEPEYEYLIEDFLSKLTLKKLEQGCFRFCGREYHQDDEFNITIRCKDNTEKILPINFTRGTRELESKASEGEISQMRSVVGSLAWIARQARPELCYSCSKMQSVVGSALVKHLEACNRILHDAISSSSRGIFFKAGAFSPDEAIMITVSDASWAGEDLIIDDKVFPRRSQYGTIMALGHPDLWDKQAGYIHFLGWKSGLIKRLCRSTFRAETQGSTYGTETTTHMRAAIASMTGKFDQKDWETQSALTKRHVWFTDCQSLHDYLVNPVAAGCEDKRLEIDLEAMRENLWFNTDGTLKDSITEQQTDKPRWIDTSAMLCDPLTKQGNANFASRLVQTMETGWFDFEGTPESQLKKLKQQKARADRSSAKDDV